jgi:2'-hydroxyisoflavone reductase
MELLLLGGTRFLSRAIAGTARDRGIRVTCLARGTAPVVAGVALVVADRDDEDGLRPVRDRHWDAVVDVSRQPGQVRRAVRDLTTEHWVFVSSGNVYARFDQLEQDETSETVDPLVGEVMADMSEYGPAKVACELAVRSGPAPATLVRSGLIGGPGDWSGRSGYYPWRFAHPSGPDVLVPPDLDFPCALIDVDDLASWIVHAAQRRVEGTFNATGQTTTLGDLLAVARRVAGSAVPARPVPAATLQRADVSSWMGPRSLPLWIDDADWRYFATMNTTAARAHGLTTRPLEQTLARALRYEQTRDQPRQAGLTDDDEALLRTLKPFSR